MQKSDMVEKKRVFIDGVECLDVIKFGEIKDDEGNVEAPSFGRTRTIKNGQKKLAPIPITIKITRGA